MPGTVPFSAGTLTCGLPRGDKMCSRLHSFGSTCGSQSGSPAPSTTPFRIGKARLRLHSVGALGSGAMGIRSCSLAQGRIVWRPFVAPPPRPALCRILSLQPGVLVLAPGGVISRQRLDCALVPCRIVSRHHVAPTPFLAFRPRPLSRRPFEPTVAPSRGLSRPCPALPPAQGFNASGFAVVAPSAAPASSTPVVSSAGAGTAFTRAPMPDHLARLCAAIAGPADSKCADSPLPTCPMARQHVYGDFFTPKT